MGTFGPTKQQYSPEELEALTRAFETVWACIETTGGDRDTANDEELKELIRLRILLLQDEAIADPIVLRELALATLAGH
jgi:hypothetical protein